MPTMLEKQQLHILHENTEEPIIVKNRVYEVTSHIGMIIY